MHMLYACMRMPLASFAAAAAVDNSWQAMFARNSMCCACMYAHQHAMPCSFDAASAMAAGRGLPQAA
jgi:hypothetical protein